MLTHKRNFSDPKDALMVEMKKLNVKTLPDESKEKETAENPDETTQQASDDTANEKTRQVNGNQNLKDKDVHEEEEGISCRAAGV